MLKNELKNRKELNIWVMPNAGFSTRPIMENTIREFQREHPQVDINLTIHPWSLAWSRLMDVVKGRYLGPQPDVVQIGTTWAATLSYLGALEQVPAEGIFANEDQMSAYVWDPGTQAEKGGGLYCVPWFTDIRVLYYRKDILKNLGIKPDLLYDWKGFYKTCIEIKRHLDRGGPVRKMVAPLAIPGQKLGIMVHDLAPWIWGAGGGFCSDDMQKSHLNIPSSLAGCEFYFDLINEGIMPIPDPSVPQGNFFTGHFAMQFSGAWPASIYLNPNSPYSNKDVVENFGVALLPAGSHGRYTFLGGSNLAVLSSSQKKDEAWQLVKFLSDSNRQLDHARAIGALTARLASAEKLFEGHPEVKKVFWDSIGHARRLPRLIPLGSVEQIVSEMCGRVLGTIRARRYNHMLLREMIDQSSQDVDTVLSIHRYGTLSKEAA